MLKKIIIVAVLVGTCLGVAVLYVARGELSEAEMKSIVIKFLKNTDVSDHLDENSVEIKEAYNHQPGGKVLVVDYTTWSGGHPHFMLEALEGHTAIITLDAGRKVVSAFCVRGDFHGQGIWDLVNRRWVQI
ncbi:MAG: hypothetical protein QMC89_04900 [Candidatus Hodarchaeaceae archaeon]|nr:hypothetical protein [Candidatus Hodarchaeaceae archaeon]